MTPSPASPVPWGLRPGDLLVTAGGVAVFAFSFAPFVQYAAEVREAMGPGLGPTGRFSAWSSETFMVPLTTFVVVAALLLVASVWTRVGLRRDPHPVGFRLTQLEVGAALFGFLVLLGMLLSDKYLLFGAGADEELRELGNGGLGELEVGWGAMLMLVGAAVALLGAVLNHLRLGPRLAAGDRPADQPPPEQPPPDHPPDQPPPDRPLSTDQP